MKGNPVKLAQFIVTAALIGSAALAHALDIKPYSAAALADAQKADKPVALHFHADWCPTCRAQNKALQTLKTEKGLDITVLVVNYDTERDLKRRFKVNAQSTFVVLRGQQEWARLVGDTEPAAIRTAFQSAL